MGAWIETSMGMANGIWAGVAPFMGAWIETISNVQIIGAGFVAPFMGAWIETPSSGLKRIHAPSRTLHGCVD